MPTPASDAPTLSGDLAGGTTAALLALPQALALGTLVWLPLGAAHAHWGIAAGLLTAIVGGLAGRITGVGHQLSGPRASTAVILAALVAQLAAQPAWAAQPAAILLALSLAVLGGGLLQLGLAALGFGRALKFIPYPVLAGFMFGIALLILLQQMPPLLGLDPGTPLSAWTQGPAAMKPMALLVGVVTVAVAVGTSRYTPRVPALLAAMVAGACAHWTLAALIGPEAVGATLEAGAGQSLMFPVQALANFPWSQPGLWQPVLVTALLLGLVGSIDALLCAATVDAATGTDQQGDRVLAAQGGGNLLSALAGGLFVSSTNLIAISNHRMGGRTLRSGITHSLILAGLLAGAGFLADLLPYAVLAGLMLSVAGQVADDWWSEFSEGMKGEQATRDARGNLAVAALVAGATAALNVVWAVMLGVVAATALLVARMSQSVIHRVSDLRQRSSSRARRPEALGWLREHGADAVIVELQGYLFFGSADRLRAEVESLAPGRQLVLLDMKRVYEIEASGARQLCTLARKLSEARIQLALANVPQQSPLSRHLAAHGLADYIPMQRWFADLDLALEWAEDELLEGEIERTELHREWSLDRTILFAGLGPQESATLRACMKREQFARGTHVFGEGDAGDRLYVLTQGEVAIRLRIPGAGSQREQRLAAFGPGLVFGEMALIEGKPRSADAVATQDVVVHSLHATDFDGLRATHPDIALKIMGNLTRLLAARLRLTSEQLRQSQ